MEDKIVYEVTPPTAHAATLYAQRHIGALTTQRDGLVAERNAIRDELDAALLTLQRVKLILGRGRLAHPGQPVEVQYMTAIMQATRVINEFAAQLPAIEE